MPKTSAVGFYWRCFLRGLDRVQSFRDVPLVQTGELVLWVVFPSLSTALIAKALGTSTVAAVLVALALAVVILTLDGAYQEWREARLEEYPALSLDVRYDSTAYMEMKDDAGYFIITDLLVVNKEKRRVLLRLRVSLPIISQSLVDDQYIYPLDECSQPEAIKWEISAGTTPHLASVSALHPEDHIRGHAEFKIDLGYYGGHYWPGGEEQKRSILDKITYEIEDLLTERIRGLKESERGKL